MRINVKRIDRNLPLPEYKTKGAVGFDLTARENVTMSPFEVTLIPLNLIVKVPKGFGLFLFSRSSTPSKKGIMVANGVGVIDQDYNGEEDELKLSAVNITRKKVVIEKGERICQGIFLKLSTAKFTEVKKMRSVSRGGFGTTGRR
ncbi:dUTP diphosphatase [Patescibacteria group bacterium]|nr:dUTP diphosphatase [Patescibacteria group bacterium]